jgi:hypothetical protein
MNKETIDLTELETEKEHLIDIVLNAVEYFEKKTGLFPNINLVRETTMTKEGPIGRFHIDISVTI